ncbi:MAG TPA: hypothetical protein VIH59_00465, partial [Candidatus Tectomicrobia bacterium]
MAFDLPETRFSAQEAALYATPNRVDEFADHIETLLADEAAPTAYGRLRTPTHRETPMLGSLQTASL